jgi:hypothetical protein
MIAEHYRINVPEFPLPDPLENLDAGIGTALIPCFQAAKD